MRTAAEMGQQWAIEYLAEQAGEVAGATRGLEAATKATDDPVPMAMDT